MSRPHEPSLHTALPAGCLFAIGSAAVTAVLLFVNGSLVMAMLLTAEGLRWEWVHDPRVTQFLLFSLPLVLAILQWMAIDYVRSRFRRPPQDPD